MACKEIIEELPQVMEKLGVTSLDEIIGIAHKDQEGESFTDKSKLGKDVLLKFQESTVVMNH